MTTPEDFARLQSAATEAIREHWVAFLVEGVLLTILGFAAMIVPPLASIATTICRMDILDQWSSRAGPNILGERNAGLLVVITVRPRRYCRGSGPAGCAHPGHVRADHRLGILLPGRGRRFHPVRVRAPARILVAGLGCWLRV